MKHHYNDNGYYKTMDVLPDIPIEDIIVERKFMEPDGHKYIHLIAFYNPDGGYGLYTDTNVDYEEECHYELFKIYKKVYATMKKIEHDAKADGMEKVYDYKMW